MAMVDLTLERGFAGPVAGVDEVGRGPWAGPVMAAAVVLDPTRPIAGLDDSKRLSPARREALSTIILERALSVGVGAASVAEIDALNILRATFVAMARALAVLAPRPVHALIDGNRLPPLSLPATAVVGGDRRSASIAAASIVAKVARDRLMARLGRRYPAYRWGRNAGYGTAEHRAALDEYGVTPHHRRSFAPIAARLGAAPLGQS